ncbi:MAG TPA: TlpA disulfide reductase family protein [Burkholderiales bacterium]|nr:TlpA disulfide reductase family protein [Burkholderiales bacterium]
MSRWLAAAALAFMAAAASAQSLRPWSGGPAPALELADAEGTTHRLSDYRGKAVLVNFWATWCGPCREEMPSIESLRLSMQGKPFAILAVNVGESGRTARSFAEKLMLDFPLLLDQDTSTAKAWKARVLPASFVIDPQGNIRYSYYGELDWTSPEVRAKIEALLPKEKLRSAGS